MKRFPAHYFAIISVIICIVYICLILCTDIAKIFTLETDRYYKALDLAFSSDFDIYPYSVIDRLWRFAPLMIIALTIFLAIWSLSYKSKWAVAISYILAFATYLIAVVFNDRYNYDIDCGTSKWILAYGKMWYGVLITMCPFSMLYANRRYREDNGLLRPKKVK